MALPAESNKQPTGETMKTPESILKQGTEKISYLFSKLYKNDYDADAKYYISDIIKAVDKINAAQFVIDKAYAYPENTPKEIIEFLNTWNNKYIPLYESLINIYYDSLDSYQQELFGTSWKEVDKLKYIQSQYQDIQRKLSTTYYDGKKKLDTLGDFWCISTYVVGRNRQDAMDIMRRRIRISSIAKVRSLFEKLDKTIGYVSYWALQEDTDGISGIAIGEDNKRVRIFTHINDTSASTIFTCRFDIEKI